MDPNAPPSSSVSASISREAASSSGRSAGDAGLHVVAPPPKEIVRPAEKRARSSEPPPVARWLLHHYEGSGECATCLVPTDAFADAELDWIREHPRCTSEDLRQTDADDAMIESILDKIAEHRSSSSTFSNADLEGKRASLVFVYRSYY